MFLERKTASAIMLTLLLTSMLTLAFNIKSVKAEGTIYIGAETIWPANPDDQKWNFEKAREWSDFAHINEDSAELVIGLAKGKDDTCTRLSHLITVNGGKIVKTISTKKEILAIVAEIPFDLIPAFVGKVKATGLAKYIEPNLRVQVESLPNDPCWSRQWGPEKIEADWAWNATFGNSSVLVAVVDTGINYTHPDLAANYAGLGYDWGDNDTDPMEYYQSSHGTDVAGIVAAVTNNGVGIAGLAQVKVMAEKVFSDRGGSDASLVAEGIIHATDQGAKIISMSLSMGENDSLLYDAVKYAYDSDVLLVAAAGNQNGTAKRYPAAYDEVIAVSATDQSDFTTDFSNYGDWIELAAPGIGIFTTENWNTPNYGGYYNYFSGTSAACPHVSGLAALLWSEFPDANRDWIRTRLRDTADDLGTPGFDIHYGYGRINARKAIYGTSPAINYTLAITTTAGGTTNPAPGNHTYTEGQNVPAQAIPDTGYGLDHWELDEVNVGSANPYSVLMSNNHTLHAVFVLGYTLIITTTTGGATSPSPGSYPYNIGTSVPVTATPDTHYIFDHWKLDGVNNGSANPCWVLMDNNHTLHAVFVQINYTLTITATAGGTTDLEPGIYTYPAGSDILVIAIPDTDYVLDYWELDGTNVGSTNPITVTIDADHALHAIFRLLVHDMAVTHVTPSQTIVGQGYSTNMKVTIANQGDYTETSNVTAYTNTTIIGSENVTLSAGNSAEVTFTWNTTGFPEGNYTISAYAWPVPGETDIADNTLVGGIVQIVQTTNGGGGGRMPYMN